MLDKDFRKRFLVNRDDTGRFIVRSLKTGKAYYVEPIDSGEMTKWGDYDPASKRFLTENYGRKHKGSVSPEESMITEDAGFDKIYQTDFGESPFDFIRRVDDEHYKNMDK